MKAYIIIYGTLLSYFISLVVDTISGDSSTPLWSRWLAAAVLVGIVVYARRSDGRLLRKPENEPKEFVGGYREAAKPEVDPKPRGRHRDCGGTWWSVSFPSHKPPPTFKNVSMKICDKCAKTLTPQEYAANITKHTTYAISEN